MKRILLATLLAASGGATAAPFYLDVGVNYDNLAFAATLDKACVTCTSLKQKFTYTYESESVITDLDGNGVSTGDSILTNAGFNGTNFAGTIGTINSNLINSFIPDQTGQALSNNGYSSEYVVTFGISNWAGTVTVDPITNVVLPSYGPGVLEFYFSNTLSLTTGNFTNFTKFMNVNLSAGGVAGPTSLIFGEVDFTGITDLTYANLFNVADPGQCGNLNGFYEIWNACGPTGLDSLAIDFIGDFNTDATTTLFNPVAGTTDQYSISTDHDGSGRFDVPEPGTLSLLGLSLLGLGGFRMRKAADKKIAA